MSLLNLLLPLSGATAVQDELGLRHLDLICLGFLIAAMAKSAQIIFSRLIAGCYGGPNSRFSASSRGYHGYSRRLSYSENFIFNGV